MTGPEFKALRNQAGLTQAETAALLGYRERSTVCRWEADKNKIPYLVATVITQLAEDAQKGKGRGGPVTAAPVIHVNYVEDHTGYWTGDTDAQKREETPA